MNMIFLNGEFVEDNAPLISHRDCGFTTGIGIFDSMLAKDGNLIHGQEHYERIVHDTKTVIGITPLPNPPPLKGGKKENGETIFRWGDNFHEIIQNLIKKNNVEKGYARIRTTVTGGEVNAPLAKTENLSVLIDVAPCSVPPETPVTCVIITDLPRIAGCVLENCKRLDYTRSYAARRKAESLGAQEAILINTDGNIACGATSNIFIEENGTLITPPLTDGVLAGITRQKILEKNLSPLLSPPRFEGVRKESGKTACKWGDVREDSISTERLRAANKIYLTNSFIGLREVNLISDIKN